ncbi:MAG TPA: hypothetical protein VK116_07305, partial [Planctomycetota bacterium]|nr:hypothetical protein [Planctomycetota bacterium]
MTREARSLARRIIAAAAAALVLLPSVLAMGREPEADRVARIALGEWESVTRDSRFVAGIAPRYDISRDRAVVALEPGEATYLAVSAGESLVVDGDREIAPADFTVEWTFGRRLFVSGALSRTPKDARILVLEPDPLRDRTVKIERLASSKDALEVALWIVRARSPRDVTRRMSLDAQGDPIAVDVRDKGDRQDARYFRLEPEHALRFDTRGERRVRVTLRVVWNADDPRVRRLDLELRAGDSTLRRVAVRATPLTTRHVLVDGRPRIASVEHAFEIELPNDASEIEVTSTAAALVRADAIIEDPVLLDSFKLYGRDASLDPLLAPRAWLEKARPALARFGVSLEDPVTIDRVIDVLRDLSTDERYPEASLLSVSLARGLAAAAPVADVRSAARALALEMTSFLALGPNELPLHAGAIEPLRWIAREPLPEGEAPEVRVLSAAKPGELLRGIDRSLFVRLDARGRELEWTLPQRRYPSLARLIVAPVHAESAPAVLLVETDGECKLL